MYKFMNNPYLHGPYMEADKGGGAGGSGADDGDDGAGGDDQDDGESDEGGEDDDQDEKKFSQKDIDDAVKKRLAREKRKWQREQQKSGSGFTGGSGAEKKDQDKAEETEADKKARKAEEKAAALEMRWTCLEHDVKKDCVDDVLALAKVNMAKDEELDIEDAIDAVLKKYPQFKDGYDDGDGGEDGKEKKGWGQRHGKPQPKATTVEDEIRKQMFGK